MAVEIGGNWPDGPVENEVLYLDKARWLLKYEQILSNRDVYAWSKVRVMLTA